MCIQSYIHEHSRQPPVAVLVSVTLREVPDAFWTVAETDPEINRVEPITIEPVKILKGLKLFTRVVIAVLISS